ncbi:hypothetical protein J0H58_10000 [bacterium]|nr:hypothetical protein [bacterium]
MFGSALPNRLLLDRAVVRMCCHCRRVRTVDGWEYETVPESLRVSHGICRACFESHYPEFCPAPCED